MRNGKERRDEEEEHGKEVIRLRKLQRLCGKRSCYSQFEASVRYGTRGGIDEES